jgi:hypothetical protein
MKILSIAIIGINGLYGNEAIKIFNEQSNLYIESLELYSLPELSKIYSISELSEIYEDHIVFRSKILYIKEYTKDIKFSKYDFVMLFTPSDISKSIIDSCKNLSSHPVIIDHSISSISSINLTNSIDVIYGITPKIKYNGSKLILSPCSLSIMLTQGLHYLVNNIKLNKIISIDSTIFLPKDNNYNNYINCNNYDKIIQEIKNVLGLVNVSIDINICNDIGINFYLAIIMVKFVDNLDKTLKIEPTKYINNIHISRSDPKCLKFNLINNIDNIDNISSVMNTINIYKSLTQDYISAKV